jgi:hypothetical protein
MGEADGAENSVMTTSHTDWGSSRFDHGNEGLPDKSEERADFPAAGLGQSTKQQ